MLFMTTYSYRPEHRDAIRARLKATGGPPPPGVKMLGRWTRAGGGGGFSLAEASDVELMYKWASEWSDLMTLETIPVLADEQLRKLLGS